ncbi:DJ-1/PfpI family protein [Xanthomonas campestris]|uniref:DJ-1/PfpI family protein n=1 Tax=Xanthomonas campestris TaxID=339 RepID=UPI001E63CF2A|nr:DJ-1/PfpI family protein [Xanthomonas campestris]MCC5068810.1 DJ-1/PfpI family protein [Xanthomonas campestris]
MSIEADQTHASRARRTLLRNALLTGAAMMAPGTAAMAKDVRPASAASGDLSKGTAQLTLGMVVFDGFQLLDVFGPLDMFGNLDGKVRIVILGEHAGMIASSAGPAVAVDHALDAAPHIDILMVPGGMGTRREVGNTAFIASITRLARSAPHVASICTGAALLARTGLLDGRRATTNKRAFNWVMTQGPKVEWVKQARWVEDGHVFTSSGVSAGTDMALALISKLFGPDAAKQAADIAEYCWNADSTNDPFTAAIDAG